MKNDLLSNLFYQSNIYKNLKIMNRAAVLNLWAAAICLVGRDQGLEFWFFLCESLSRLQMEISVLVPEKCKMNFI